MNIKIMTIGEFLKLCKQKLYLIIILPLIFGAAAAFICWGFLPNEYTSSVSLYVLQNKSQHNENANITSSDVTTSQQLSNDIAVLVKSNRVNNAVMEEMGIDSLDSYKIKVTSAEKNRVINISATGKNPNSVAQVVNCIARQTATLAVEIMNVDAVNIIEEAHPADAPSGPNRPLITLIAIFAGLFVAVAIIIISDMVDTTVKDDKDIKENFDLPVLAEIPYIKG